MSAPNSPSQTTPTSVEDILRAYSQDDHTDKEILLAILKAKTAEDQRIAALATLNEQCVAFAMQVQQDQKATTSRGTHGGAAAAPVAQNNSPSNIHGASSRDRSSMRTACNPLRSLPPSPPYTPNAVSFFSSSATPTSGPRSQYHNHGDNRRRSHTSVRTYHQSSGEYQQYPPLTISLPPIQVADPQVPSRRGSISATSQRRLPQVDMTPSAYPNSQRKMNIHNILSRDRD